MLAAWTSKGALTIFSCESGAVVSSATASDDTKSAGETSIIWIRGDQCVMIISAIDGMQIRDVHTCAALTDDYVYIEQKSVFQPTGTGSYANYSKQFPSIIKADVSGLFDDDETFSQYDGYGEPCGKTEAIQRIISYQTEAGSYELDVHIATFLGYESVEIARKELHVHFSSPSYHKFGDNVYITAILLCYFRGAMANHQDMSILANTCKKASTWLSACIGNVEIERELLEAAKTLVIGQGLLEKYPNIGITLEAPFSIPKNSITKAHIETIYNNQHEAGAFFINNELALSLGFDSEERFRSTVMILKNKLSKRRLSRMNANIWPTIFILLFWRLVAIDYQSEWLSRYEISYKWLYAQFKARESVEKDAFELTKSLITELYKIDEEVLRIDAQFEASFKERKNLIQSGRLQTSAGMCDMLLLGQVSG